MISISIDQVFHTGWWKMAIAYGALFYMFQYMTYTIIFKSIVGSPTNWSIKEIRFWRRKAQFIGAVFFAPLFEEFMITLLAYASFIQYAREGQEGIVVIMVATFFALLHIPVDVHGQRNSYLGIRPFILLLWQLERFFYSLAAFFLFKMTGTLWSSIVLHYVVNGFASVYNFDMEDGHRAVGSIDIQRLIIVVLEIFIVVFGTYQYHQKYPNFGPYLIGLAVVFLFIHLFRTLRFVRN